MTREEPKNRPFGSPLLIILMCPADVKHRTNPLLNRHPLAKITVAAKGGTPPSTSPVTSTRCSSS